MSGPAGEVRVEVDLSHGGRWTSLVGAGRDWLWRNPDPSISQARAQVGPGEPFVDAGGGEECLPTIQGSPDHGEMWSRPWVADEDGEWCASDDLRVHRSMTQGNPLRVRYKISGAAGRPLLHAVHLLLDLSPAAWLDIAPGVAFSVAGQGAGVHTWPMLRGVDQSRFGPDDGSAACLSLPGVDQCRVIDGADVLHLRWGRVRGDGAGPGLLIWRNLGGWPEGAPYRSVGIEPLLGAGVDHADLDQAARLDVHGTAEWWLSIAALSPSDPGRYATRREATDISVASRRVG